MDLAVVEMSERLALYVTRRAVGWLLLWAAVLAGIAVVLDGLERASTLAAHQVATGDVARYLALRLATAGHLIAPLACGLAATLTVSTLRHRGEWDGMRALGAGARTLRAPFVLLAALTAVGLACFEGYALPRAIERVATLEASAVLGGPVRLGAGEGPRWWNLRDGVLIAGEVAPTGERLTRVTWLRGGTEEGFARRVDAREVVVDAAGWTALDATTHDLTPGGPGTVSSTDRMSLELDGLTPGGIRRRLLPRSQRDLTALLSDPDPAARFTLHARLAHPLAVGLLCLLAASLAAMLPGGRALAAAVGVALALGLTLIGLVGGALAPAMGWPAWLPWGLPALFAGAVYWTTKAEPSLRNQPLVQSA